MEVTQSLDALKKMATALESELRSLLIFYGENPDGQEPSKPEDLFNLILSFSSSLQVRKAMVNKTQETVSN